MPVDANIAMGYQPVQMESPLNLMSKAMAIKNAVNQNALAQYQLSSAKRADDIANAMNDAYRQAINPQTGEIDAGRLRSAIAAAGAGSKLPDVEKGLSDLETARLTRDAKFNELVGKRMELSRTALEGLNPAAPDAAQQYLAWHEANHADPVLAKYFASRNITAEQSRTNILAKILNPDGSVNQTGLANAIRDSKLGAEKALESHFQAQDYGGGERLIRTPKYDTGDATIVPGSDIKKTQSPDAAARLALERGDERNKVASTTTDNAGNVHHWNKFGEEINAGMGIGKGKPSATFEKTQAQQKQMKLDLDTTISELEKATAPGGLIEKATGSGIGAGADWAAGLVGKATEGSIAIGALQPIYDKVLKMVPRFEGPQSDKDTASYNNAAGNLANPNTPKAVKLEAAKQILRLMKDRKNQFLTRDMAEGGNIVPESAVDHSKKTDAEILAELGVQR